MRPATSVLAKLPRDLATLATDRRLSLHDGRFDEVVVDTRGQSMTIVIDCGDLQVGYRRLTLVFEEASIVPDDLQLLAAAVGAEFRANHWTQSRTVTEVLGQTSGQCRTAGSSFDFGCGPSIGSKFGSPVFSSERSRCPPGGRREPDESPVVPGDIRERFAITP